MSDNTRRTYRRDLTDYISWFDFQWLDLLTVKRPVIDMYRGTLDGKPA